MIEDRWLNVFVAFESELFGGLVRVEDGLVELMVLSRLSGFDTTEDGFVEAVDKMLSSFYEQSGVEADKSIFIVSQDWLIANDLTPTRKEFLRKVKKQLELKVSGFVVLEEAVIFAVKKEQTTSDSFFFLTILEENIGLTRVELGRVSEHVTVSRSQNLKEDMAELISRLKHQVKPLKMVVFSQQKDLIRPILMNMDWQQELGFVQDPEIIFWDKKELFSKVVEVVLGDAQKKQVRVAMGDLTKLKESKDKESETKEPADKKEAVKDQPETVEPDKPEPMDYQAEADKDWEVKEKDGSGFDELAEAGVILGGKEKDNLTDSANPPQVQLKIPDKLKTKVSLLNVKRVSLGGGAAKVWGVMRNGGGLMKKITSVGFSALFGWLGYIGVVLPFLILPVAAGLLYYFVFKAVIVITPKTEALTKNIAITLDPSAKSADFQAGIIPARQVEFTVDKKVSVATSGTTETGEPGQGVIIIFNKSSNPKTFKKGAVLYLTNDKTKKIVLEETVQVASQSSQTNENEVTTLIPGKAEAKAKTSFFGEEANLPAGKEMFFEKLDTKIYKAKVKEAFTGGKKYEVKAVSKDDVNRLKDKIKNEVEKEIDRLIADQIKDDEEMVKSSLKIKYEKESLSAQVGKPAESVTLTTKAKISVLVYKKGDVAKIVDEALEKIVPGGFLIDKDNVKWSFKPLEKNNYQLQLKVPLKWSFDTQIIRDSLQGKDKNTAYFYLSNLPGVYAFKISFQPPVPGFLQRMPYKTDNILVKIQSEF
ncbi:MAG: hypothetical protein GXP43_03480 [bacterium]|nr:hypothetical protein [bacterium]